MAKSLKKEPIPPPRLPIALPFKMLLLACSLRPGKWITSLQFRGRYSGFLSVKELTQKYFCFTKHGIYLWPSRWPWAIQHSQVLWHRSSVSWCNKYLEETCRCAPTLSSFKSKPKTFQFSLVASTCGLNLLILFHFLLNCFLFFLDLNWFFF